MFGCICTEGRTDGWTNRLHVVCDSLRLAPTRIERDVGISECLKIGKQSRDESIKHFTAGSFCNLSSIEMLVNS